MTLDEAIKHCKEVAEHKLELSTVHMMNECYDDSRECSECAKEHTQLMSWLGELKYLRSKIGLIKKIVVCDVWNDGEKYQAICEVVKND